MGRPLILTVLLFCIVSCRQTLRQEKYVPNPTILSFDKYSNSIFSENFYDEDHYSFTAMTKIDSLGHFSGEFVDATTGQKHLDTTKYFYSAEVFAIEQNDTTFLRNCKIILADTTLKFVLNDDPFSQRNTELEIVKMGKDFKSNFVVTAIPTDSSYKLPTFIILTQNVILDKQKYEKGNNLKGKISLTIKAFYPMSNIVDTIRVFGLLKTTVD